MGRKRKVQTEGLAELQKASKAADRAEAKRAQAIYAAHDAGSSLRTIAEVTGLSHETVRVIFARERERIASVREQIGRLERTSGFSVTSKHERDARILALTRTLPVKNPDE